MIHICLALAGIQAYCNQTFQPDFWDLDPRAVALTVNGVERKMRRVFQEKPNFGKEHLTFWSDDGKKSLSRANEKKVSFFSLLRKSFLWHLLHESIVFTVKIAPWKMCAVNPRYSWTFYLRICLFISKKGPYVKFQVKNGLFICEFKICDPKWRNVSSTNNEETYTVNLCY
jgi:hypothetical protein